MSKKKFYVIDGDGMVSFNGSGDTPESFGTFDAAAVRAKKLAEAAPGDTIHIVKTTAFARAAVTSPTIEKIDK
jgi:hypothetical protein